MGNFLGLDLGTSSLKALLIDDNQRVLASASAELHARNPAFGWSEQDPADWVAATQAALDALMAEAPAALAAVEGIGLSGQMHGATLLDATDAVLRPCILWNDTRAHAEAAELDDEEARAITGNIVFPGFTAPKLVWVARHEPETFAKTAKILLPKDYLRLWLTGETVSDLSDAAGTAWLDTGRRDWSERMLERTGLTRAAMPRLVEGSAPSGGLRADVAARWGLKAGTPVAGGAGDNAASACGVGAVRPGTGFVSLGTSGVLFAATSGYRPVPGTALHTFCHALPGLWHQMGVTLSAAGSLQWLSRILDEPPATLAASAGEDLAAPGRTLFLPYLSGERTPHNDASVRGAFLDLSVGTERADLVRAVMEGVAFSMRDCLDAGGGPGSVERLVAVGAGARSPLWLAMLATALETEIVRPASGDFGAAFGAARLGLVAATGADPAAVMVEPEVARRFAPDAGLVPAFRDAQARYRAAYPAFAAIR